MRGLPWLLCLVWAFPVAAVDQESEAEAPDAKPDTGWFEKLLAREAEPLPVIELRSGDGYFEARVPAKIVSGPDRIDGDHFVQLDGGMGTEEPVECWVFHDEKDLAGSLLGFSEATFDQIGKNLGEIEERAVQHVHAGSLGPVPYLGLDWIYRVATEAGPRAGQVKHRIASREGRSVYCQHASVGYSRTFQRVFEALVESMAFRERPQAPHYVETQIYSLDGQDLGVGRITHVVDEDGDVKITDTSGLLMPFEARTLRTQDTVTVTFSTREGSMINQLAVEADDGKLTQELRLDPADEGGWKVTGTFQGEPMDATIEGGEIRTDLGERLDLRRFLRTAEEKASTAYPTWSEDVDPTRILATKVTLLGRNDVGARVTLTIGPLEMAGVVDENGSAVEMTAALGSLQLKATRAYTEGSVTPPKPDGP